MIDMSQEKLITLADAAEMFPDPPSSATLWRWVNRGVRGGIKLEVLRAGAKVYTSEAAIRRFLERQTAAADGDTPDTRSPAKRKREISNAEQELADAGI